MMRFDVMAFCCDDDPVVVDSFDAVDFSDAYRIAADVLNYDMGLAHETFGEEGYYIRFDGGEIWQNDDMYAGVGDVPRFNVYMDDED